MLFQMHDGKHEYIKVKPPYPDEYVMPKVYPVQTGSSATFAHAVATSTYELRFFKLCRGFGGVPYYMECERGPAKPKFNEDGEICP